MHNVIVSDTSCLISLRRIDRLSLLEKIYGKVFITSVIEKEFRHELPDFIQIKNPSESSQQKVAGFKLDAGESTGIALALENENSLLIIDEKAGRDVASELGINIVGTIGILLEAKKKGYIESLKNEIEELKAKTHFRISDAIVEGVLILANEK